jgi:predicted DNA-binding transcriptional regulator YafY
MDNHLASSLLSGPMEAPCLIWLGTAQVLSPDSGVFAQLVNAVSEHRKVTLLGNGCRCTGLAPYRLVLRDGEWYLTGEHQARIAVFPLAEIRAVTLHNDSFTLDTAVRDILSCPDFLQALPHFRFFNDVISTFRAELH